MSTIGLLNILMKANTSDFTKGIRSASDSLSELDKQTDKLKQARAGQIFAENMTPMEKYRQKAAELKSLLKGGFIDRGTYNRAMRSAAKDTVSLTSTIGGLVAALGTLAAASSFKSFVEESAKGVLATTRMADRLGVTTEALSALDYAAGQSLGTDQVEAFNDSLSDMQERLADVVLEEGGARDIVKMLGLDAAKMATQDAITNFKQITKALEGVESRAEKLHILDTLMGGQGQSMLGFVDMGVAGIEQLEAEAEKLGVTFSRVDGAKVEAANKAIGKMSALLSAVGQSVAIELSPYVEAAANAITDLGTNGLDAGAVIQSVMQGVGTSIGIVADIVHTLGLGWKFLQATVASAIDVIMVMVNNLGNSFQLVGALAAQGFALALKAIADVGSGIEWLLNQIPGVEVSFGDALTKMAEDAQQFADDSFANIQWNDSGLGSFADDAWAEFNSALMESPPSEAIDGFFNNVTNGAQTAAESIAAMKAPIEDVGKSFLNVGLKVSELTDKLNEQIATYGKSSTEVEIYKLKALGANDEQIAGLQKLSDALKAKQLVEENMTPIEKYKKEFAELQRLLENGAIDNETFNRAKGKLAKDSGLSENKFGGQIIKAGSDEARQTILRHQGIGRDPNVGVEQNTKVTADENKKQTGYLKDIAKHFNGSTPYDFN